MFKKIFKKIFLGVRSLKCLSYKDFLVLIWGMDDYTFQELHWKYMCCASKESWFCV